MDNLTPKDQPPQDSEIGIPDQKKIRKLATTMAPIQESRARCPR